MGKIYIIMGKSSSGKDTIFKQIQKELPDLHTITLYTTRPIRAEETEGIEYYFVNEDVLNRLQSENRVIELREYHTKCGIWKYFTADDGQIDLENKDYLIIGTLESYKKMCMYFGAQKLVPLYIEVQDGQRLERALKREQKQKEPKYEEMCRRFLADQEDFSEKKLTAAQINTRFANENRENCIQEICTYIKMQNAE